MDAFRGHGTIPQNKVHTSPLPTRRTRKGAYTHVTHAGGYYTTRPPTRHAPHGVHLLADGVPREVLPAVRRVVLQKRGGLECFGEPIRNSGAGDRRRGGGGVERPRSTRNGFEFEWGSTSGIHRQLRTRSFAILMPCMHATRSADSSYTATRARSRPVSSREIDPRGNSSRSFRLIGPLFALKTPTVYGVQTTAACVG